MREAFAKISSIVITTALKMINVFFIITQQVFFIITQQNIINNSVKIHVINILIAHFSSRTFKKIFSDGLLFIL